jgi:hypothetical protein
MIELWTLDFEISWKFQFVKFQFAGHFLDFFFFADIEMKLGVIDYNNDQV